MWKIRDLTDWTLRAPTAKMLVPLKFAYPDGRLRNCDDEPLKLNAGSPFIALLTSVGRSDEVLWLALLPLPEASSHDVTLEPLVVTP